MSAASELWAPEAQETPRQDATPTSKAKGVVLVEDDEEEQSILMMLWEHKDTSAERGISLCEWYKGQTRLNQRILDKHLSPAQREEIQNEAMGDETVDQSGFVAVKTRKKSAPKDGDGGASGRGDGRGDERRAALPTRQQGVGVSKFAALDGVDAELQDRGEQVTWAAMRKEKKKQRREEERQQRREEEARREEEQRGLNAQLRTRRKEEHDGIGPVLESNDPRDELEQQLAKSHSTAVDPSSAVAKRPKHKKLKREQLEQMTVKQIRRALADRGIGDEVGGQWVDKPDELKLLREYAKSLPSVCEEAAGSAKAARRYVGVDAKRDKVAEVDEIDQILAELDAKAADQPGARVVHAVKGTVSSAASTVVNAAKGIITKYGGKLYEAGSSDETDTSGGDDGKKARAARMQKVQQLKQDSKSKREEAEFEKHLPANVVKKLHDVHRNNDGA